MSVHVDVLVVGSGPGGAVTARECAHQGLSVLVVEEGSRVAPGSVVPFSVDQMQRQYRNEGLTVALGRPSVAYTEGRCLGGGSEVNSGLYHRPPVELLDRWDRTYHLAGLSAAELDHSQQQIESRLNISPIPDGQMPASSKLLESGASVLGWSGMEVPRWGSYTTGAHGLEFQRQSMSRTYLADAEMMGAELSSDTRAVRLLMNAGRCRGVLLDRRLRDGRMSRENVRAERVVVAAGATQSPALLQRSGILGRGMVGGNLGMHPTVKVVAEFDRMVNDGRDVSTYQVKEFAPWLSFGGSASTQAMLALQLSDNWSEFGGAVSHWNRLLSYYAAIVPQGRGRVTALPGVDDPLVTFRLTKSDVTSLRSGLARLMHLLSAAGASAIYPSLVGAPTARGARGAAAAADRVTRSTLSPMSVHLVGTARMGGDPKKSVTDPFGRVHGVDGLSVHDASILPEPPGVNPQGTIMALAQRNTQELLK